MIYLLYVLGACATAFVILVILEATHEDYMKPNWLHIWLFVLFWPIAIVAVACYTTIDWMMRR